MTRREPANARRYLGLVHLMRTVAIARVAMSALLLATGAAALGAQELAPVGATRIEAGRFTVFAFPEEERLARSLLAEALARDTFPGLARPQARVTIALAPDARRFREWVGRGAPEWGAAIAFPAAQRIIMQGRDAGAAAGDPAITLRHELAHLILYEMLGASVPRWFDEGYASYAAGEWGRDQVLITSFGLVWRGLPTLAGLDSGFYRGAETAQRAYALAHHAVSSLAGIDRERGLSLFFEYWRTQGSFERALRSGYGMTELDFEREWRGRVRRQYGALALAADLTVLTLFLGLLLGPLWWQRRKRQHARLQRLRDADAAQEARERERALAALLGEVVDEPPEEPGGGRIKGS